MTEKLDWKIIAFERNFGAPHSVYKSTRQRSVQFNAVGDVLNYISSEVYERALRSHIVKQFADSRFQNSIKARLQEKPDQGLLIVVGYHVTRTSSGPRYQNVGVHLGPSAPSAFVAIQWEDARGYMVPNLSPARYKRDFLWLEPNGLDINRVFRHQLPENSCGFTEYYFNEMNP